MRLYTAAAQELLGLRAREHHAAGGRDAAGRQSHKQTVHDAWRSRHSYSTHTGCWQGRQLLHMYGAQCDRQRRASTSRVCRTAHACFPGSPRRHTRGARGEAGARGGWHEEQGPPHRRRACAPRRAAAAAPAPWPGPRPGGAARGAARRPGPPGTAPAPACARRPGARSGILAPHAPHHPMHPMHSDWKDRPGPPGTAPAPACARRPAARSGILAPHAPHAPHAL